MLFSLKMFIVTLAIFVFMLFVIWVIGHINEWLPFAFLLLIIIGFVILLAKTIVDKF
jgi:hypothetical protein